MSETLPQKTHNKLKILSIEDDYEYAYLLREMLSVAQDVPFDLVHAGQLSTGRKKLKDEAFDLILLDLSLPDSWGFDTFASIHRQAPNVPIIILSSLSDKQLAVQAVQKGALDYLVKGQVDAHRLRQALHQAIKQNQTE